MNFKQLYILFVFTVVMPFCGFLLTTEKVGNWAFLLIAMQIPWFIKSVIFKLKEE